MVMPRVQPIRSAITVAGMSGVTANNRRIAGSKASTAEPGPSRSYFGASSLRNAARTVLRATPSFRTMAFTPMASARCSRLISAHSSTLITVPLPVGHVGRARLKSKPLTAVDPRDRGVSIRPVIRGQYSSGGDSLDLFAFAREVEELLGHPVDVGTDVH